MIQKTCDLIIAVGLALTLAATTLNSAGAKPCKKGWESCGTGCYDPKVSCCCKTKKAPGPPNPKRPASPVELVANKFHRTRTQSM
jgi:hypothetical protein